jgi:nitrous oxidase accessory protein
MVIALLLSLQLASSVVVALALPAIGAAAGALPILEAVPVETPVESLAASQAAVTRGPHAVALSGEFSGELSGPAPERGADASPRTLRVGLAEAFATPAAALAAARAGDIVRVGAGVYRGGLVVDRRVVLIGEPGAILDGEGRGTVVTVTADSVELRGFLIRESGRSLDRDEAAVKVVRSVGARVVENRIEDALHGVYLLEARGTTIEGNEIVGDASLVEARRGNGIHLFNSRESRIEGNTVRGARDGIYFSFASANRVLGNHVSGTRYGLHYMYSDDNLFHGNHFARNAAGAAIMFSKRVAFRENQFVEHIGYRAYGVLLQTSEGVVAERNRIEGNLVGIFFDNSIGNLFRENLVVGNGTGIDMLTSAEGNIFTENAIVANRTAVRTARGGGKNAWAADGRGNYWGDRGVFDLDGDGIGDRPYRVGDPFASLAALRPVLEIFAGTPAALALSWAEQAFPVFGLPRVEDPAPLVRAPVGAGSGGEAGRGGRVGEAGGGRGGGDGGIGRERAEVGGGRSEGKGQGKGKGWGGK